MSNHIYTVQFRLYGSDLVPSEISAQIGLNACNGSRRPAVKKNGKPTNGIWAYDGSEDMAVKKTEWSSLEEGIIFVLEKIKPYHSAVLECSKIYQGIWWCGHFQSSFDGGPTLSVNILKEISQFGFPIFIDNYFFS